MRRADRAGKANRKAWRLTLPEGHTTLGSWLVHVPGAHPFWSWWLMSVVHLREVEGVPVVRQYPEAEYEFLILAINPDAEDGLDPDDWPPTTANDEPWMLWPPDVVEQFHGVDDETAKNILDLGVAAVMDGAVSPDSDYRRWWRESLARTVEHAVHGGHPS